MYYIQPFTREKYSGLLSKGACLFYPMEEITVDPKGHAKLLVGLNVHKTPDLDELNVSVRKDCLSVTPNIN